MSDRSVGHRGRPGGARDEPGRRAFRRTGPRLWLTVCAGLFCLIFVSGLFAGGDDGKETPSTVQRIVVAPLAAASLWTTIGVARQGIWTDRNGVKIRNVFRTHRLYWDEIKAIQSPVGYGVMRNSGISFVLQDGRRVNAALYSAGPLNRSDFAAEVVAALREERERRLHDPSAGEPS